MSARHALVLSVLLLAACGNEPLAAGSEAPLRLGSKQFTESVVLGELFVGLLRAEGVPSEHLRELGGSRVLFDALRQGDIDAYPEYTGTLRQELVPGAAQMSDEALREALAREGLAMGGPLGFNNTYALGMKEARAEALGIRTLSDLARHPGLRFGMSHEFLQRQDGWPSLRERYGLSGVKQEITGLEHDLAYRALDGGDIDVTDLYATDAEIPAHGLRVLEDDLRHFPAYDAVLLHRIDVARRFPRALPALRRLEGRIDEAAMSAMNAEVKLSRKEEAAVAAGFLRTQLGHLSSEVKEASLPQRLWRRTREHLGLVGLSLAAALVAGVPLGVLAAKRRRMGQLLLGLVGLIQTIPSLALLVFMIPLLGIQTAPAVSALFLYSLLPIVRGTHQGLTSLSPELRDVARALGLPGGPRLWRIELPLASPAILGGIKTAAVINIGTATLGALIGAGGYGQPILAGIRRADTAQILEGAIPAALLALVAQAVFELAERALVPRGLRLRRGR